MYHKLSVLASVALLFITAPACNEAFDGSNVYANIYHGEGFDERSLISPGTMHGHHVDHYELYAGIKDSGTVRLAVFNIRPVIETAHPCLQFIPDITRKGPDDGKEHYLNMARFINDEEILAVVSVAPSDVGPKNPGYDFDSWSQSLRDIDGNLVKDAVDSFCSRLHEDYYIGNPIQLSTPFSGKLYGVLDGHDPRNGLAIGGVGFITEYNLEGITSLFIVADPDPSRVTEDNIDENLPPNPDGHIILLGERDGHFGYMKSGIYEGDNMIHGLMVSPDGESLYMEFTVYYNLNEDKVWF